jgi:enamine deaminase RidA (YjgF/YER057c/UK114 family)
MTVEEKLETLNVKLPPAPQPIGAYVPAVRAGRLVFLAAQIPTKDGKPIVTGKLGAGLTVESVGEAVRVATLNALSALKSVVGELDKVTRVVKLTGYIASAPGFTEQPEVLNHASKLLLAAFGERGRHARAAVGVAELPRGVPVELDLLFEVEDA